ncbi:hypothetical protein BDR26DRAFT_66429 [Obelidium mucronatum]|nr:hypothetical protein BDR26DRAFT_66429 [Obelidium mucronatum]
MYRPPICVFICLFFCKKITWFRTWFDMNRCRRSLTNRPAHQTAAGIEGVANSFVCGAAFAVRRRRLFCARRGAASFPESLFGAPGGEWCDLQSTICPEIVNLFSADRWDSSKGAEFFVSLM